jgi:hypothetical protein
LSRKRGPASRQSKLERLSKEEVRQSCKERRTKRRGIGMFEWRGMWKEEREEPALSLGAR